MEPRAPGAGPSAWICARVRLVYIYICIYGDMPRGAFSGTGPLHGGTGAQFGEIHAYVREFCDIHAYAYDFCELYAYVHLCIVV